MGVDCKITRGKDLQGLERQQFKNEVKDRGESEKSGM